MSSSLFGIDNIISADASGTLVPQTFIATAGQTVFNITAFVYILKTTSLLVFKNHLKLVLGTDYTETSTSSFTLTVPATAGDVIDIIGFPKVNLFTGNSTAVNTVLDNAVNAVTRTQSKKNDDYQTFEDFGAGNTDTGNDTTAIQNAINHINSEVGFGSINGAPGVTYKVNSGLFLPISTVRLNGNGARFDMSAITASTGITISELNLDPNDSTAQNSVNSIDNLYLIGASASNAAAVAVLINSASNTVAGGQFKNVTFKNWGIDVLNQNGAFCWSFNHCTFTVTIGTPTTYSIVVPNGFTNAGERNMFIDCFWFNRTHVLQHDNPNADTFFVGCSIDGQGLLMSITQGDVHFNDGHIEIVDDTVNFNVTNSNSNLFVSDTSLVFQAARNNNSPFNCDSSVLAGGIHLDSVTISAGSLAFGVPLVSGTGPVTARNIRTRSGGSKPAYIAASLNRLEYGDFESANYTAEFALASGAIRSTAQFFSGTHSLSLPGTSSLTPSATVMIPAEPGDSCFGIYRYFATNLTGSSGTLFVTVSWADKANASIFTASVLAVTITPGAWTLASLSLDTVAPAGTVALSISFSLFGTAGAATPIGYIDTVLINLIKNS